MPKAIPITDDQRAFIANGIYRAVSLDMPDVISDNGLPTAIGSGLFRWNFINRNLSDSLGGDFETAIVPRGSFKVIILRDRESNFSFSAMTEANFRKIQQKKNDRIHYLEALISKNKSRTPMDAQMTLFGDYRVRDMSLLFYLRDRLLSHFTGIVEEHILILFDYNCAGVTSARAVLLTPEMEIAYSEDWTRFLRTTVVPKGSLLEDILDDNEVLAALKPEFVAENTPVVKPATKTRKDETA